MFDRRERTVKRAAILTLAGLGALSLTLVIAVVLFAVWGAYREQSPRPDDLAYIVNWANLGSARIVGVRHAYVSRRNWIVGDQVKAYCLKLDQPLTLSPSSDPDRQVWLAQVTDPLLVEAITTASSFPADAGAGWFPTAAALNSGRFMLSFPEVTAYHGQVEAVKLTAYDTQEHLLYHSEVKW